MKHKNTRVFSLDGKSYKFNFIVFMRLFIVKAAESEMKLGEYEQFLADKLTVSKEAIHNWRNNLNGPSGIEVIQKLAEIWKINFRSLIKEIKEVEMDCESMSTNIGNTYTREAIKRVYGGIVDFLEFFEKTDGLQRGYNEETNSELVSIANTKKDYIIMVLRKEMLDIPKDLYDEMYGFINDRLNYLVQGEPLEDEDTGCWTEEVICVVEETYEILQNLLDGYRL